MRTIEAILTDMQAVLDGAQGRNLTADEVTTYTGLEAELATARASEGIRNRDAGYRTVVHGPGAARTGHVDETGPTDLERAFNTYLRTGKVTAEMTALQPSNALSEGTGSEGGYLVPDSFRTKLVERLKAYGGIATVAEEINTSDGRPLPWPTVDDVANVGEIVEEGGTFSAGADIVFGTASLGAYSYMSGGPSSSPVRVSRELLQDAAFDVEALISRLLGIRIGRIQAVHLARGSGVGQPLGLLTGKTGIELVADTAGITYDDLVNFKHSVDPAYREGGSCKWVMNDTSLALIEKIKDSHGDPVALQGRTVDGDASVTRILGYPVVIDQACADIVVANNTINWGAFGDIRQGYVVRRVKEVEVLVNPYARQQYRQIEFSAWARMDATQQDSNAYVALTGEQ